MLTHDNDNFPSDVFTIMAAVGATVTLGGRGWVGGAICVRMSGQVWLGGAGNGTNAPFTPEP